LLDGKKITAIILVAGNSTRYGKNCNKNFEILNHKTVLSYSLNAFDQNEYIDEIMIAGKIEELLMIQQIVEKEKIDKEVRIIQGGDTRKESVYHCIKSTNSDIVIIHDGARPLIRQEYINQCLESMKEFVGVSIGVKSKDTIKITDENGVVCYTTNRDNTWLVQTPQCFDREILLKLHQKYDNEVVTDDCSLLEKEKYKVKMIQGDVSNIKITTSEDFSIIKELMK